MPERIAPNPPSPHADADPQYRHLIPSFFGLGVEPGVLALAACGFMAVAPDQQTTLELDFSNLPDGICPQCVAAARHEVLETGPELPVHRCVRCDMGTRHAEHCAVCRQQLHDEWRAQQPPGATA